VLLRPEELRADTTPTNEILVHDTSLVPADLYLQTHSTNPLLKVETIRRAIAQLCQSYPEYDSLFGVTRLQTRLWDELGRAVNHNPAVLLRTQDLPPIYEENSCIYLFTRETLLSRRNRLGERPMMFEIDAREATDIDEELDFVIAETLMAHQNKVRG
jgi:CMP-N-acetylneuraminic acid synthetase